MSHITATVLFKLTLTVTEMAKWLKNIIKLTVTITVTEKLNITETVTETEKNWIS